VKSDEEKRNHGASLRKRRGSKVGLRSCEVDMNELKPECILGWTVTETVTVTVTLILLKVILSWKCEVGRFAAVAVGLLAGRRKC
jgi:hypothetical protein